MDSIYTKDYAKFMEEALQAMVELPVEGICIITKLQGGAVFTNYFKSNMMDKISYAGLIQQDATLDMLKANKLVKPETEE
jgi:hypothetical protein